jgi:hypothetical protein
MWHVFHLDVAKVDRDIAHVAIAIHICCKRMFQVFQMFHLDVACVSSGCYKSRSGCCTCCDIYTHMLQVYVPNVSTVFESMLQVYSKCFSYLIWMLHVFHLDVAYVIVTIHVCCNCVFQIFTCFGRMLQWLYTLLQAYVCNVSPCFRRMLQQLLLPTCSDLRPYTRCTHPASATCLCHASSKSRICT